MKLASRFEFGSRPFFHKTLVLMLPVILQQLITIGINFLDNLMIGDLGTNAISGITIVGAISAMAIALHTSGVLGVILGFAAIVLATINVVGGYMVTDRMLGMFKKKGNDKK